MHDDFGFALFQKLAHAVDRHPGKPAADMIRVRVGDEGVGDLHVVLRRGLENRVDLPRRIDHRDLARLGRTDEIHVVLHRADFELFKVKRWIHHEEVRRQNPEAGRFSLAARAF